MPYINKIEITGFKAFPDKFTLTLEGKHLLMYGENGSGKSSIFYSLHCIFQSPLQSDGGNFFFTFLILGILKELISSLYL